MASKLRPPAKDFSGPSQLGFHGRLRPVRIQSAPEAAAETLREAITNGTLKPGQRLIEQKLAASLGIGQPTLREALKELEHEGFVYKIPQKGTYITVFNKSDCCELLEMRMSLEILAIEKAARNMTPRVEEELEALVAGMSTAADAFDIVRFHKCDAEFHRKISALSNNSRLAKTLESIISQMFVYGTLGRKPESRKEFVDGAEQHRQILNGLASKDRSEARRAFVTATLKHWNDCYQLGLRENDISAPVILTRVEASPEAAPA